MRKASVIASLFAIGVLIGAGTAVASHAPNAYCSESGDVCANTQKIDGVRKLTIATAAKYFDSVNVCVRAPDGSRVCKKFPMHKDGTIYRSSVGWRANFPDKGQGAYTVRWKAGGSAVTPKLGFHVTA